MLQYEMQSQGNVLFRWRSYLPIIILLGGLAVYINTQLDVKAGIRESLPFSFDLICLGVASLGLLIRIYTVGHTPKNTSGRNTAEGQVADEVKSGTIGTGTFTFFVTWLIQLLVPVTVSCAL